jgi:EAL and modified HD-GYP domain-containing signal transduction protein
MTAGREVFVARQPILDRHRRIVGYELLYRNSRQATHAEIQDSEQAALQTLLGLFVDLGSEALLGSRLGFLNVPVKLLCSDAIEALPRHQSVIEILESVPGDAQVLERCRELRRRGFTLALDDFEPDDPRESLLSAVDYVKVDVLDVGARTLRSWIPRLRRQGPRLLAEKVESSEDFERCQRLGFELFQGFFFARPETLSGTSLDPGHNVILEILGQLRSGTDLGKIERAFKQHAALGVNLLRLVNSVALSRGQEIATVRQALVLLGERQLERWLVLLLFAGSDPNGVSSPLLRAAAMRGRVMELICMSANNAAGKEESDRAFLIGMLSLLDALLGAPLGDLLSRLHVDDGIRTALLERAGQAGALLDLAEHLERGDFAAVESLLEELAVDSPRLLQAQLDAHLWIDALESTQA